LASRGATPICLLYFYFIFYIYFPLKKEKRKKDAQNGVVLGWGWVL
jgi:hypothetical protein